MSSPIILRRPLIAVTSATVLLAGAGAGTASAAWNPAFTVSPRGLDSRQAFLGPGRDGASHVAYGAEGRVNRLSILTDGRRALGRSTRLRGGAPVGVGFDARGRAVVLQLVKTRRGRQGYSLLRATRLDRRGRRLGSRYLSRIPQQAFTPRLAVNGVGDVLVAWAERRRGRQRIVVAQGHTRRGIARTGPVSPVEGRAARPAAALNDRGDAAVAFAHDGQMKVVTAGRLGAFGEPQPLGAAVALGGEGVDVGLGPAGEAVVAWSQWAPAGESGGEAPPPVHVATRAAGQPFSDTRLLEASGAAAPEPDAEMSGDGIAWIAWVGDDDDAEVASARAGAGGFEARTLSAPGLPVGRVRVTTDAGGGTIVAWSSFAVADASSAVQASVRGPGGDFGAAETIWQRQGRVPYGLDLARRSSGGAALAFTEGVPGRADRVRVATFSRDPAS